MVQRKVKWPLVEADKSLTWQALQIVAVLLACTFRLEAEKWRRRGRKKGKSTEKTGHKSNLMAWACVRRKRSLSFLREEEGNLGEKLLLLLGLMGHVAVAAENEKGLGLQCVTNLNLPNIQVKCYLQGSGSEVA